ncbi:MAG: L-threonylcarbamoyladenylate synthase [Armatimonadetes bacterium]|nr:L-threonylcarbamoyladenylate synthase [Armatimonadota bacterium]
MIALKIDPENPDMRLVQQAAEAIRAGELVVFPTETVYGLAADALNEAAVARIFEAKGRVESNPLPVQVSGVEMLSMVAGYVPRAAAALAERFWPGPLTLVLEKSERISRLISAGTGKVGVRVPDHAVALALLRAVAGPIVASSANVSGELSARNADDAIRQLGEFVSVVLDAGESAIGVASTVVDVTVDPPVILRHGAISDIDIEQVLAREINNG